MAAGIICATTCYLAYPKDPEIVYSYQSFNPNVSAAALECGGARRGSVGTLEHGVYLTCGDDQMQSIASMTKVITALVILDDLGSNASEELKKSVTLDAAAFNDWQEAYNNNGSNVRIAEGETVTKEQMLYAIELASANNLAETLTRIQFGSFDNYKAKAQDYLQAHGLTNTVLGSDASGFDDQTKSNSTDMLKIGVLALQNPILAKIVSTVDYEFPSALGGVEIEHNTNKLLKSGFSGIKTGYADDAGHCIVFAKKWTPEGSSEELTVIGVVMGETERDGIFADAVSYSSQLSNLVTHTTLIRRGETVGTLMYSNGLAIDLTADEDLTADIFASTEHEISANYDENSYTITLNYDDSVVLASLPACDNTDYGINFIGYLIHKFDKPYC